jgi:hypothetical protein
VGRSQGSPVGLDHQGAVPALDAVAPWLTVARYFSSYYYVTFLIWMFYIPMLVVLMVVPLLLMALLLNCARRRPSARSLVDQLPGEPGCTPS